jgi:hypothetical protein
MNALGRGLSVGLSVLASVLVGGVVFALPLDETLRRPALVGVGVALVTGLAALALKLSVGTKGTTTTGVKVLLGVQVGSFFLRMIAVGVGMVVLMRGPASNAALAYVLGFFGVYVLQQAVEVGSLLAHRAGSVKSEVISR